MDCLLHACSQETCLSFQGLARALLELALQSSARCRGSHPFNETMARQGHSHDKLLRGCKLREYIAGHVSLGM